MSSPSSSLSSATWRWVASSFSSALATRLSRSSTCSRSERDLSSAVSASDRAFRAVSRPRPRAVRARPLRSSSRRTSSCSSRTLCWDALELLVSASESRKTRASAAAIAASRAIKSARYAHRRELPASARASSASSSGVSGPPAGPGGRCAPASISDREDKRTQAALVEPAPQADEVAPPAGASERHWAQPVTSGSRSDARFRSSKR